MGAIQAKGALAIAELAFFAPTSVLSFFIVLRHGFSRQAGWIFLLTLSILRIIGSSCTLYSEMHNDYSVGLLTAAAICNSIGTAPLLLVLLGFMSRVHMFMTTGTALPSKLFRGIQLASLLALILSIIGGTDQAHYANPSKVKTGQALNKVASVIFLLIFLSLVAITLLTFFRRAHVADSDMKLVYAGVAVLPFLLVRIAYAMATGFSSKKGDIFYVYGPNIYVQGVMQFAMEALIMLCFITAGLLTPKQPKTPAGNASTKEEAGYAMESPDSVRHNQQQGYGFQQGPAQQGTPAPSRGGSRFLPENPSAGDYRPIRMIKHAARNGRR